MSVQTHSNSASMLAFVFREGNSAAVLIGLATLVAVMAVRWVLATLRPPNFPPGPPVTPGLGNLLQIPMQKPFVQFQAWAKQYGDLFSLKTGTSDMVIINSPAIVHELFDKRGAIYSNRPDMYVLRSHIFYEPEDKAVAVLQYDEYYRRWRKTFQSVLSTAGVARVRPLLEAEACNLAKACAEARPYKDSVRAWSLAVPVVATTGQRLEDLPKGFIDDFFQTQEDLLKLMIPGTAPPVDIFPILQHVPAFLAKWKSHARAVRKAWVADAWRWYHDGAAQRAQIEANPASVRFEGLISRLVRERQDNNSSNKANFSDLEIGYIGQALVGAAVDTTSATFETLLCCFAAFPAVLRKAQEEVDRVVGTELPPSGEQVHELPYLRACISETLRWRPTTPLALPHTLTKDDRFGDHVFPKGTTFIANAWAMHRNPDDYDKPDDFVPERFLAHPYGLKRHSISTSNSNSNSSTEEDEELGRRRPLYAFGSGRRQCPGEQFAFTTILLAAAKLVWAFNVLPPEGGGLDLSIETGYKDGTVLEPIDPTVRFVFRDARRESGLQEDHRRAEGIARDLLG